MTRSIVTLALGLSLTVGWGGVGWGGVGWGALATDVAIGRATEHSALDPLFSDLGNDVATAENMFESMTSYDAKLRMHPNLALSWTLSDPLAWDTML